ncbi:MAG: phosphatidylethanolamine/phosphatidyl-N-methylethanolamine N-methyltransferase [Crocinitomicaceae bacterium]|jgi:phosphatidylethanolamine/phosphatidyl-N-methylethanolamine N-methyltransferase
MTSKRSFLKQFFKDRKVVGAVSPSTRFLGDKMLADIDFDRAKNLVELGPGTGVFTDIIIQRMHKDAKLLVLELNDEFYHALKARIHDPRVQIIHDSAENISKYLSEDDQKKQDAVISSLPLMVFSLPLRKAVIDASYEALKPKGKYVQFQYSLQSKKFLEGIFADVKIKFTVKNFPPAFVYTCRKS